MRGDATRSGRDTGFATVAVLVSSITGSRFGLSAEEIALLNIATFAVVSFGYRLLRKYMPWATTDDGGQA